MLQRTQTNNLQQKSQTVLAATNFRGQLAQIFKQILPAKYNQNTETAEAMHWKIVQILLLLN